MEEQLKKAIEELKELGTWSDYECAHSRADDILCEVLKELGHAEIVEAWDNVGKWYA